MAESDRHKQMKRVAQTILEMEGYNVEVEKRTPSVQIDVFATRGDEEVAVELGELDNERARHLKEEYGRLVHIPYERIESGGNSEPEKQRASITVNPNDWEELKNVVGPRERSRLIRDFARTYIELFGDE